MHIYEKVVLKNKIYRKHSITPNSYHTDYIKDYIKMDHKPNIETGHFKKSGRKKKGENICYLGVS